MTVDLAIFIVGLLTGIAGTMLAFSIPDFLRLMRRIAHELRRN